MLLHIQATRLFEVSLTFEQTQDISLRTVEQLLGRIHELDPMSLMQARDPGQRLIGNCRAYAVLFVSICRPHNIPARMRIGFAPYFDDDDFYNDHWIAEYWHAKQQRWVLVDPGIEDERYIKTWRQINRRDLACGSEFILSGDAW